MADGLKALQASGTFTLRRIKFVPARNPDAHSASVPEGLIPLNDPLEQQVGSMSPGLSAERALARATSGTAAKATKRNDGGRDLYREEDVQLAWRAVLRTGPGLANLGNTCFMNSVLQCLTYTAPLAQGLVALGRQAPGSDDHSLLRITQDHIFAALNSRCRFIAPRPHAKSLRKVNRSFRLGRQEDAHEYLIALLDAMHENIIDGIRPKPPPAVAHTSMIYRIFGGRLRSQVKCSQCGFESNTFDPFLDASLEVTRARSLDAALQRFTAGEVLDGDNQYRCPRQGRKVRAVKRISFDALPNVLILQLKRFEFSMFGHKIGRKIDFSSVLDMSPYMSEPSAVRQLYELYAVLVHSGNSVHSGHYYAFVRASNGLWYCMDDCQVRQVSERLVLQQKAYMLFYVKQALQQSKQQQYAASPEPAAVRPKAKPVKAAVPVLQPAAMQPASAAAHDAPTARNAMAEPSVAPAPGCPGPGCNGHAARGSGGGQDAGEQQSRYVDKLAERLTTMTPAQLAAGSRRWKRMCTNLKSNFNWMAGTLSPERAVDPMPQHLHSDAALPLAARQAHGAVVLGTAERGGNSSSGADSGTSRHSTPPCSAASWPPQRLVSGSSDARSGSAAMLPAHEELQRSAAEDAAGGTRQPEPPQASGRAARGWLEEQAKGAGVLGWDGGEGVAARSVADEGVRKRKARYDEWDAEYDVGRLKKVRNASDKLLDGEGNQFQQFISSGAGKERWHHNGRGGRGDGRGGRGGRRGGRGGRGRPRGGRQ